MGARKTRANTAMNGPMKAQPVQERRGLDRRGDGLAATGAGAADVVISIILARVRRMGGVYVNIPQRGMRRCGMFT
ncbi:hypothetical protein GCM10009834_33640 [Streptomonospora arabica]